MNNQQQEIETFLAAVVQGCAKFIVKEKTFCFDIKFEINDIKYRLTMAQEEKENAYLKDN